ncbi:MAG: sugar ABC transporter permease [Clostridia bacterium]|nr:sugar ABC transporter permease [Clostridia bacterium]
MMGFLEKLKTRKTQRIIFIVGMLALPLLQWLIFFVFVNINTITMSFQDQRPGAAPGFSLVNYRNFFMDLRSTKKFVYAIRNSLLFGLNDFFLLFISLVLAYFFYKKIRWSSFFRIIFFLPSIISIVIFITAYQNMFNMGVIDSMLNTFGIKELPDWFANTSPWLVPLIMLYCLWVGTGYNVLIMGGAMGNLPEDVMEYSRLEGVNYFHEFFRVVIPMIWPTVMVGVLGSITIMFTLFLQVDLMTVNGGTTGQAMTVAYMINGYVKSRDLGRASTYGVIFTIIAMPIIILIRKALDKVSAYFGY